MNTTGNILQGSVAKNRGVVGGVCNDHFIADLLLNMPVKETSFETVWLTVFEHLVFVLICP